jgi:hypothetical protein
MYGRPERPLRPLLRRNPHHPPAYLAAATPVERFSEVAGLPEPVRCRLTRSQVFAGACASRRRLRYPLGRDNRLNNRAISLNDLPERPKMFPDHR